MQNTRTRAKALSPFKVPTKIKVLHIIKSLGRGGAEKLLVETLSRHDHSRFEFHYIYFLPWKNQLVDDLRINGGTVTCYSARSGFGIFLRLFSLIAYIRKHKVDVIHSHLPVAGIVARFAGFLTRTPVVYTEHNTWERYHRITYFVNKFTFRLQKKVIAVSREVSNSIFKHYKASKPQIEVVRNGVNVHHFERESNSESIIRKLYNIADDAIVIGVSCVFRAQKRLDVWLEVASRLHKTFPDLHFIIVGDGVLRESIHRKAAALQTSSYVTFAGLQTDMKPYLEAMDMYMMTSEFEGLPVGLLEAMSMGCVPACTSAGGIGEIITDGENGAIVPVDQPHKLYDKICELILQPEKMDSMKAAARLTVVSQFDIDTMVRSIEDIYRSSVQNTLTSWLGQ